MKCIMLLLCLVLSAVQAVAGETRGLPLTDTGVTAWGNGTNNALATPQASYPRQDADLVREQSLTKLDNRGKELPVSAPAWSCVRDNITGLVWEVKTADGGLHGKAHTYTWHNPGQEQNGGHEGTAGESDDTTCGGAAAITGGCDTGKFVKAVNAEGLCGFNDWRMPSVEELSSIVNYGKFLPAINTTYFPDIVMPAGFWTASTSAASPGFAWIVIFDDGYLGSCIKSWPYYVRVVRGGN